jgi:TonB-linked SusC/RagA family outer membrane protein
MAQSSIKGKISDEDGEALAGATVIVKGATIGANADENGDYALTVPEGYNELVVSYIGYNNQTVSIDGKSVVNVTMISSDNSMEEVLVTGYSRQKKSVVTGAISSVNVAQIENVSAAQLQSSIQGRTAGVSILPTSGSPGSGFKVRIRGTGSNGNSDPLYIVDGMRTRDISFISANEIANIEVLKDAASAAIYGAEGANGVVIITTRSGSEGNSGLSYNMQIGSQRYNGNLELMTAEQHAMYMEEAGIGGRTVGDVTGNTDWIDEVFETAMQQKHTLSFSGGNSNLSYYLQGSYFDQDGIVAGDNDNFKRISVRANIDNQVNRWLKVGARMNYANTHRRGITEDSEFGGILANAILMDPATPVSYTGALPTFVSDLIAGGSSLTTDADGNIWGLSEFVTGEIYNPLGGIDLVRGNGTVMDRVVGSVYGTVQLIEGLTVTSRLGVDNTTGNFHTWSPSFFFSTTRQANNASVQQNHWRNSNIQWENFANYDKSFGDHSLGLVAGTSVYKETSDWVNASGTGLIKETETFAYLGSVQPGVEFTTSNGGVSASTLASFFGRINYAYANKYLLTATVRQDGSSLLADGAKWGTFPSVSAGWVFSREDFFGVDAISFGKLRASWGQNGSLSNLNPGAWRSAIGFGGAYPDGTGALQVTASPTILSNPELTWETSEQIDIGIDLGFFGDALTLTADYFNKQTNNLLNPGVIPAFVGNNAPTVNLGDISNKGFELELGYKKKTGDFNYDIAANFTRVVNVVTRLDENLDFANGTGVGVGWTATAFEQGLPAWYFRGYQTDGILQSAAEADAYNEAFGQTAVAGDPRVVDVNGDGAITPDDQAFIGSPHPDFLYGLRVGADYKGFDFTLFVQGVQGNDILAGYNRTDRASSNKPAFYYNDRWTESNPSNTWFRANGENIYAYNSDLMVFDGSYLRVKQIMLGYNFSKNQLSFTRGGRLYVSLEDIMTFTSYQGFDPETGSGNDQSQGIDRGVYPLPAKMFVGFTLNL